MTQFADAESDVKDGNWTPSTSGADLYEMIDSPSSDSTYDQSEDTPNEDAFVVQLSKLQTPQDVSQGGKLTVRLKRTGTGDIYARYRLLQGSAPVATKYVSSPSASFQDETLDLSAAQLDRITDFSNLSLEVTADSGKPKCAKLTNCDDVTDVLYTYDDLEGAAVNDVLQRDEAEGGGCWKVADLDSSTCSDPEEFTVAHVHGDCTECDVPGCTVRVWTHPGASWSAGPIPATATKEFSNWGISGIEPTKPIDYIELSFDISTNGDYDFFVSIISDTGGVLRASGDLNATFAGNDYSVNIREGNIADDDPPENAVWHISDPADGDDVDGPAFKVRILVVNHSQTQNSGTIGELTLRMCYQT